MANVLSELDRIKQNETFNRNETKLLESLSKTLGVFKPDLNEHRTHLNPFIEWCAKQGVRHCVAKPAVVAQYLTENLLLGEEFAFNTLKAIEALHDFYSQPSPARTQLVHAVLAKIIELPAPRSWKREAQTLWPALPPDIRWELTRREKDRDREVRERQNEAAELRHKLNAQTKTTETKPNGNFGESHPQLTG
jgi:hypothetical protein